MNVQHTFIVFRFDIPGRSDIIALRRVFVHEACERAVIAGRKETDTHSSNDERFKQAFRLETWSHFTWSMFPFSLEKFAKSH